MRSRKALAAVGVVFVSLLDATARGQVQTASVRGTVVDETTGEPLLLVSVVATSAALQGIQAELTDELGQYYISALPAGRYTLVFILGEVRVKRENVDLGVGRSTVVNARMRSQTDGEVVTIEEKAPAIDSGSTKQGLTVRQDYLRNLPSRGRSWQAVLGAAAGSQSDTYGTSFSGSTSIENSYIVDGVNTSSVTLFANLIGEPRDLPVAGSNVITNFIQEIEVITGGYNAELGRSTGGVVNVVTKTGSNELHGSVFANLHALYAESVDRFTVGSSLSSRDLTPVNLDFGFELGGPIVKDRLWFYAGFAPVLFRQTVERIASRQVDRATSGFDYGDPACARNGDGSCDADGDPVTTSRRGCELSAGGCEGDGQPDLDAASDPIFEEVDRKEITTASRDYQFTAKLNLALTPDHQGQLSLTGTPRVVSNRLATIEGTPTAGQFNATQLTTDSAIRWTSKLFEGRTQIDALAGWHRYSRDASHIVDALPASPDRKPEETPRLTVVDRGDASSRFSTLGAVAGNLDTPESLAIRDACVDGGADDAFPLIPNCPVGRYSSMSRGPLSRFLEERLAAKLAATQRVRALGQHQLKAGLDLERNHFEEDYRISGGLTQSNAPGGDWSRERFIEILPEDAMDGASLCVRRTFQQPAPQAVPCRHLDVLRFRGDTLSYAAFVQDSWSILPNLTVNAGLRYDLQYVKVPERTRELTVDPITGERLPENGLALEDLVAPRLGVSFDWTKEGRSKIYANWGRFHEALSTNIVQAMFDNAVLYREQWSFARCEHTQPEALPGFPSLPDGCPTASAANPPRRGIFVGGVGNEALGLPPKLGLVMDDLGGQYLDEFVLGVEYEVLEDLRVGLSYQNRTLGRVIEDVAVDPAFTYFLANPGEFSEAAERSLVERIRGLPIDDPARQQLINRLEAFVKTRAFDRPRRTYDAVQLLATKRFSRAFFAQGSYTWSRLEGNYAGLFLGDTDQLAANLTAQFDHPEFQANRGGRLPYDRPHAFRLDAYHQLDLGAAGAVTTGARLSAQSGVPISAFGGHWAYGDGASLVLPRGSEGRTGMETSVDLHVGYRKDLGELGLELTFEVYNLLNRQGEVDVDGVYTFETVDPIVGGDRGDLPYLKSYDVFSGTISSTVPAERNLNFGRTAGRQDPLSARIGAILTF